MEERTKRYVKSTYLKLKENEILYLKSEMKLKMIHNYGTRHDSARQRSKFWLSVRPGQPKQTPDKQKINTDAVVRRTTINFDVPCS